MIAEHEQGPRAARSLPIRLALAIAVAALQGCAKPHPAAAPAAEATEARTDDQLIDQLRTGTASLSCGAECEAAWTAGHAKARSLYDAQDWRALAEAVERINYQQDLGYYYLGRAAEELRFYVASLSYYRTAVRLSTTGEAAARCRAKLERCDGTLMPSDALLRISIVSNQQARARALAYTRRSGSARPAASAPQNGQSGTDPDAPGAGAGDPQAGGLIDPPPVAR